VVQARSWLTNGTLNSPSSTTAVLKTDQVDFRQTQRLNTALRLRLYCRPTVTRDAQGADIETPAEVVDGVWTGDLE